jgi:hypothetical protein
MPPLAEQHKQMQGFTAVFTVLRLLMPLKMAYEAVKTRAEPYTKIVERYRRCDGRRWCWSKRPWQSIDAPTYWSIIDLRAMRHCRCRSWWMASADERMAPHLKSILKVLLPRAARDTTNNTVPHSIPRHSGSYEE